MLNKKKTLYTRGFVTNVQFTQTNYTSITKKKEQDIVPMLENLK